jgi:hypothetical protein
MAKEIVTSQIEITSEMVEAGCDVLRRVNCCDLEAGWISEREVLTKILAASLSAICLSPKAPLSPHDNPEQPPQAQRAHRA